MQLLYLESLPSVSKRVVHYLENNEIDFLERSSGLFFVLSEKKQDDIKRNIQNFLSLYGDSKSNDVTLNVSCVLNEYFSKEEFSKLKDCLVKI